MVINNSNFIKEMEERAEIIGSEDGKAVVREQRIPFEIKVSDEFYGTMNQMILMQSVDQLNQNKVTTIIMEELEDMANE